jgi:HlyD family secretion protein
VASRVAAAPQGDGRAAITALGRLEPRDGILPVAGPSSRASVVIARLLVEEGEWVEGDAPLAVLDTQPENEARVARIRAELRNAEAELGRVDDLFRQGIAPISLRDANQLKVDVALAELRMAQSALDQDTVRAPVAGQVVKIHARRGMRVGSEGILELARNDQMYAVAQVYETDIGRVQVGQRASVRSPAFAGALGGTVERVGLKVGRSDLLEADPTARTDGRVVPVHVRLDDSRRAAALSNLQVEVAIAP